MVAKRQRRMCGTAARYGVQWGLVRALPCASRVATQAIDGWIRCLYAWKSGQHLGTCTEVVALLDKGEWHGGHFVDDAHTFSLQDNTHSNL